GRKGGRGVAGEEEAFFGLKYLTNSRLLRLQLKDPTLRLQVLSQWLILAMSLRTQLSQLGPDSSPPEPISAEALKDPVRRAKRLMMTTPPNGKEYLEMLDKVVAREGGWVQWKQGGCKAIEREPPKGGVVAPAMAAAAEEEAEAMGLSGNDPVGGGKEGQKKRPRL
ncbi:unnamed protein product, partial [Discosporangium mesarthrocarpum]